MHFTKAHSYLKSGFKCAIKDLLERTNKAVFTKLDIYLEILSKVGHNLLSLKFSFPNGGLVGKQLYTRIKF